MVRPATLPDCLGGNGRISCAPTGNANAATIARLIIVLTALCLIACLLSDSVSSSHRFDDKGADRVLQSSPKFDEGAKDTACASPARRSAHPAQSAGWSSADSRECRNTYRCPGR